MTMIPIQFFVRVLRDNRLAAFTLGVITSAVSGLVISAGVLQTYNTTGVVTIPWLTLLAGAGLSIVVCAITLLTLDTQRHKRALLLRERQQTIAEFYTTTAFPHMSTVVIWLAVIAISTASLTTFITSNPTAFVWPATDMGPFFERQADASFAPSDFFTNTSSLPNPRQVFGYGIVALTSLFNTDWYTIYFVLQIVFVLALPALFFLALITALRKRLPTDAQYLTAIVVAAGATLLLSVDRIMGIFSIGWWPALNMTVLPQTVALTCGLVFIISSLRRRRLLTIGLLTLATLVHPAIGLFMWVLYIVLDLEWSAVKYYLAAFGLGVVLPMAIIAFSFPAQADFSGAEFIYHYIIENHAFHYLPSALASFTSFPWYFSFGLITVLYSVAFCFGVYKKDVYLSVVTAATILVYTGCVVAQYVFVELYPVKAIAALSPVRFSMFGYWFLVLIYSYGIARYLPLVLMPLVRDVSSIGTKPVRAIILVSIFACLFSVGMRFKDDPRTDFVTTHPALTTWIREETSASDVLAVYPKFPPTHVPLLLHRGVFTGNGFPFTEDGFIEHNKRKALLFGTEAAKATLPGQPFDRTIQFYRDLTPQDFYSASTQYRLDYVVLETAFATAFSAYPPAYRDEAVTIYKTSDFYEKK